MNPPDVTPPKRPPHLWGRREWLTRTAWSAVAGSLLAGCGAFVRLLYRRAPVEDPTVFRAGRPDEFAPGTVSAKHLQAWRVFVVREADDLFAVHARCTHLGCTPRWYGADGKFKCPCHGSGFTRQGVNFEGPAPRPLERARIWLDAAGDLWIDVGRRYGQDRWQHAGASVRLDRAPGGRA